jgi:uncharacterized membrane protein YccC
MTGIQGPFRQFPVIQPIPLRAPDAKVELLIPTQALSRRLQLAVKAPPDPGFAALRRAARAAIVIPLAFAFADLVLRQPQSLIFVVFGCFSLLVISDFGGLRPQRAIAYLTATVVGAVLVALGTLASSSPWLAAFAMLLVGFVISFSRVFGGYTAAANLGMLLAFVIAVTIPGSVDVIPARVGGWAMAGLVSTAAAVALWPRFERVAAYHLAAKALPAIADLVDAMRLPRRERDMPRLQEIARKKVDAARSAYATTAKRPFGPRRRDRAFAQLLVELDRLLQIVERPFNEQQPVMRAGLVEADRLVDSAINALRSSAEVLTGGAPPDLDAIEAAREQHRVARDRWAAEQLKAGRPAEQVLDGLDFEDTLRVVSYLAFTLGSNAVAAAGAKPDAGDTAVDVIRTIQTHLESPSTVLQGSLRVAIGLALAVWVASTFGFSHGFWVVLGTIQVLRSNALGTGRTIVLAVVGNVIGVAIGGLFAAVAGNHPALMWMALPITVFGAAYSATTIGFMLSQAAFTINLIVVFNLITPAGWQVGLVRIEDVIVGALISLLVGLLLWPQGARRELARGLGSVYQGVVAYLEQAFDQVLGFEAASGADPQRQVAIRARDRVGESFETFITERGASPADQDTAALLLASANQLILAGDLLVVIAGAMGYAADRSAAGAREVRGQVQVLLGAYGRLADELNLSRTTAPESQVSMASVRHAELNCLRHWQSNPDVGRGAMAVVMAGEWVQNLARLEVDLEEAVTTTAGAAQRPWWR